MATWNVVLVQEMSQEQRLLDPGEKAVNDNVCYVRKPNANGPGFPDHRCVEKGPHNGRHRCVCGHRWRERPIDQVLRIAGTDVRWPAE